VDDDDERQILDQIARARADADVVIVSLHAHEPRNESDEPAAFIRRFAHSAIDAGAALVVGHGPHRLRGIEAYGGGAILYSVGNFIFESQSLESRALDVYDSGVDLYQMAMGAIDFSAPQRVPTFDDPVWWEAVIARATFDRDRLTSLQVVPIDLGTGLPPAQRGFPRLASPGTSASIVSRLSRLSAQFDTRLSPAADRTATVDLSRAARR
jgi:poly-gamma-glutamate synthesis protein (capsule biosynthesis protein)